MIVRIREWLAQPYRKAASALIILYFVAQMIGLPAMGLTDDDDFYIPAGISYAQWLGQALTLDGRAWTQAGIDAAFKHNHEHPPVAKYVFGICHFVFRGVLGPTDGARVGTVLFSTLAAAVLLILAFTHLGPRRGVIAGGFAVLALLTLPRFYFHSHAATLDVPVASMYLAAAALALLAERHRAAAWGAGVAFGLATATKLNGPFLVMPYLAFAVLVRWRRSTEHLSKPPVGHFQPPSIPAAMVSMALIGPIVFFASWPWMWFDTANRVREYVQFHLHHYGIYFLYFGRIYDKDPFAPWHAPFTMAAITVPVSVSVLALIGVGLAAPVIIERLRSRSFDERRHREADLVLSVILHAIATIGLVSMSGGPKYGGAKLFMPFFPFWCLLAGYGVLRLVEMAGVARRLRNLTAVAALAALTASSALLLKFGGYALSQYNALTGGLRGATAIGFERQYYDVAFRDLVDWLNDHAPKNARIHFLPNNWEYVRTYKWYRKAGELRADIRVVKNPSSATLIIITHERRFARYGGDLKKYRQRPVLKERVIDGVPLWSVLDVRPP
ncbi:MAG: glycosyltransferase family 39 protein [Myxococcota bacterium]